MFFLGLTLISNFMASDLPEEWKAFLHYDRNHNIALHDGFTIDEPPRPLHFWKPRASALKQFSTSYGRLWESKKTSANLRQHFPELFSSELPPHFALVQKKQRLFREAFGAPDKIFEAIRIQGHGSFFVWDPSNPAKPPFVYKPLLSHDGDRELCADGAWLRDCVDFSSVFAERAETVRFPDQPTQFLPEPFGGRWSAVFKGRDFSYSYLLRDLQPFPHLMSSRGSLLLPLHGVLSSRLVEKMAENHGYRSRKEWLLNEHIPRLAQFFARMHWVYGLFPMAHTQNLRGHFNIERGTIRNYVPQDLADVMNSPSVLLNQGLDSLAEPPEGFTRSLHYKRHFYNGSPDFDDHLTEFPGHAFAYYSGQSIFMFEPDLRIHRDLLETFLWSYLSESEHMTGRSFQDRRLIDSMVRRLREKDEEYWSRKRMLDLLEEIFHLVYQDFAQIHEGQWRMLRSGLMQAHLNKAIVSMSLKGRAWTQSGGKGGSLTALREGRLQSVYQGSLEVSIQGLKPGRMIQPNRMNTLTWNHSDAETREFSSLDQTLLDEIAKKYFLDGKVALLSPHQISSVLLAYDGSVIAILNAQTLRPMAVAGPLRKKDRLLIEQRRGFDRWCGEIVGALAGQTE